jgi:hypothetical protein
VSRAPKKKAKAAAPALLGGHDLGLAKLKGASTPAMKKKPQTAVDRLNDLCEGESARLSEKQAMQHEEEMACCRTVNLLGVKRKFHTPIRNYQNKPKHATATQTCTNRGLTNFQIRQLGSTMHSRTAALPQ